MTVKLDRAALMDALVVAALEAGAAIWEIFKGECEVIQKADASPVTAADHAAEAIILAALAKAAPGVPVVAEEEVAAGRIPDVGDRFFLVDPLDGTKEFIRRGTDFTVNIALIEDRQAVLGVVYAPGLSRLYGGDVGQGAWSSEVAPGVLTAPDRTPIRIRPAHDPLVAVASRSHDTPETEAYLKVCGVTERVAIGSSLKFCLLAAGEADLYPRPAPTNEWDTAAGHAVLVAAGGRVFAPDGSPMLYRKPRFFNPGFVGTGTYDPPAIGPFIGG